MEIKGIIHVHSTYSYDGKLDLRSLRELLLSKGITFCCVTEHTDELTLEQAQRFVQECHLLSGSQFVFIPGFEVPYLSAQAGPDTHILLIGTEVFLGQKADAELLTKWSERSALTILAHPVRNRFVLDEVVRSVINGVEIWNQQYDGKWVPRPRSLQLLRTLQQERPELIATGGSDLHRAEHFGSPVYTLDVGHATDDEIIVALKNNAYVFGNKRIAVAPSGLWKQKGSVTHNVLSFISIGIINVGKTCNRLLAKLGWKLPKGLLRFVRSRV